MTKIRKAPKGILGFPVAPLTGDNQLDENALYENIRFLVDGGLEGIFVSCGAGELQSLSMDEYRRMISIAQDAVKGEVPLYTGVGGNISIALEQAKISEELGAEGYLILPPYLIHGEQEGVLNYITTIIESTDLNAIIYQRDNAVLELEALISLVEYPQFVGVKDGIGNMEQNVKHKQALGDRVSWLNGMPLAEVTMATYLPLGYDSYSSAISNYIPHISRRYFEALQNGDQDTTNEILNDVILPINEIRKKKNGYAVALIKAGMEIVGLSTRGTVRPPVVPVEKEHYEELERILEKALQMYPVPAKA